MRYWGKYFHHEGGQAATLAINIIPDVGWPR